MARTVALARTHGVAVGAHPGTLDLYGFGRRRIGVARIRIRHFLPDNIQKGPGQVFPYTKIREDAFDRGGKP